MKKTLYISIVILINIISFDTLNAQWVKILDEDQESRILLDIFFLKDNPDYGWICGRDSRLLRTTDRGETWEEYKIDRYKNGYNGFFESVFFLNPDVGYVSGISGVYKSTDGGKTWRIVLDENLWGCYFVDEDYGIVVGKGCENEQQHFYRTTDGGDTWEVKKYYVYGTALTDVYLESREGFGLAVSSGNLWVTTDGGKNWDIRNSTGDEDWQEELSFRGNTFIIPYSDGCDGNDTPSGGGVRYSLDGGFTFRQTNLNAPMFGTFVMSDSVGWVCGLNSTMKKTTDAGSTWTQYDCGLRVEDDMDDIYFIDDTTGFVVGMGIYKYQGARSYTSKINVLDSSNCDGDPILLEAEGDYNYYEWNGEVSGKYLEVEESGTYILKAYNMACDTIIADTVDIKVTNSLNIDVSYTDDYICEGDTAIVWFDDANVKYYNWSDGFVGTERIITSDTSFYLDIRDKNNCDHSQTFEFLFEPLSKVSFEEYAKVICANEPAMLKANIENKNSYTWYKDGLPLDTDDLHIEVENGSNYYIICENRLGCSSSSDTVDVSFETVDDQIIFSALEGKENVNLGEMNIASPLSFYITVKNNSDNDFLLEHANMELNSCFSIPKSQFPVLIPADSLLDLEVRFFCADYGELKDKLLIRDRCTYDSIEVQIFRLHDVFDVMTQCDIPVSITTLKMKNPRLTQALVTKESGKVVADINYISDKEENPEINIYNAIGNKVATMKASQSIVGSNGDLSIYRISAEMIEDDLQAGFYFISVDVGGAMANMKFVVAK